MRIAILTTGSRGDVQPFVALACALKAAGHLPVVAAPVRFESLVRAYDLDFAPVRFDPNDFVKDPTFQALVQTGNYLRLLRNLGRLISPVIAALFDDYRQALAGADAAVLTISAFGGLDCAEKMGLPVIMAFVQPSGPTSAFPSYFLPLHSRRWGGRINRLSHHAFEQMMWLPLRRTVNGLRRDKLGLPPAGWRAGPFARARAAKVPWVYGYSPALLPAPTDWDAHQHVTGYWFLDAPPAWQPPPALVDFLAAGPPPVYIGFGSMALDDPQALYELSLAALKKTGRRGILLVDPESRPRTIPPKTVFLAEDVPHDWLFPQMAAVVHHGGAGTTAAALRAGKPMVITPFVLDQFAWAQAVAGRGVSPAPLPIKKANAAALAAAIEQAVMDPTMKACAAALGKRIRAESGAAQAASLVGRYLAGSC